MRQERPKESIGIQFVCEEMFAKEHWAQKGNVEMERTNLVEDWRTLFGHEGGLTRPKYCERCFKRDCG